MHTVWANNKIVQSWDRAVIAVGGVVLGLFMAISMVTGDGEGGASGLDKESLEKARVQMQCVPDSQRSPLVEPAEFC